MEVDGLPIEVEAAVSSTLPVAVLLGEDVPQLTQLLGSKAKEEFIGSEDVMVVVTRAQAQKQLEKEILRREREVISGAQPSPVEEELGSSGEGGSPTSTPNKESETPITLTQEQRRTLRQQLGRRDPTQGSQETIPHTLEMSADELRVLQEQDDTLAKVRDAAEGHPCSAGVGFFKREGLIYRRWTPPGRGEEMEIEQLVLPKECRRTVLELGHEIPFAGHMGKEKTR